MLLSHCPKTTTQVVYKKKKKNYYCGYIIINVVHVSHTATMDNFLQQSTIVVGVVIVIVCKNSR